MTEVEQTLSNKIEMTLKEDLQLTGPENDIGKDVSLDLPKELAEVLTFKREIQIRNQESVLDIFSYWIFKRGLLKPLRILRYGTKKK